VSKSALEQELALLLQAVGIIPWGRNVRKGFIPSRRLEADFLWRFPSGSQFRGLAVEVQGGVWFQKSTSTGFKKGHAHPASIERDCEKVCLAQLAGWIILPVTEKMIRDGRAVKWIEEILGLHMP
jgi:hypothetical protein